MAKKLTILVAPIDAAGHVNGCIGLAQRLKARGHRIVFAIDDSWKGKLVKYGFEEQLLIDPDRINNNANPSEYWANFILNAGFLMGLSPLEKVKVMEKSGFLDQAISQIKLHNNTYKSIVDRLKPDLIIIDNFMGPPALVNSGIPWVWLVSGNPLFAVQDVKTPPASSGLSIYSDPEEWEEFKEVFDKMWNNTWIKFNKFVTENGNPSLPYNKFTPETQRLNIYAYPDEIDYTDVRPMPPKWLRVDSFIRTEKEDFKIPKNLLNKPGKLIYLSLGSMGSADIKLMKRLITILAKSPNRFIVSKGPLHDKYVLANNMWGDRYLPQTKLLELVDLVITHGGNNTVTETLYFGKPMIVMPLFGDQYDNAQRVHEKGYGIKLDTYNCTEKQLLNAIEKLLADKELKKRLDAMSKKIQSSNTISFAAELVERVAFL